MSAVSVRQPPARVALARLAAALAVLVGIALIQSSLCADGVAAADSDHGGTAIVIEAAQDDAADRHAGGTTDDHHGWLGACLLALLAVIVSVLRMTPPAAGRAPVGRPGPTRPIPPGRRAVPSLVPSPTRLCVSRT